MCELGGALVGRVFWGDRIFLPPLTQKKKKQTKQKKHQKNGKVSGLKCWSSTLPLARCAFGGGMEFWQCDFQSEPEQCEINQQVSKHNF